MIPKLCMYSCICEAWLGVKRLVPVVFVCSHEILRILKTSAHKHYIV